MGGGKVDFLGATQANIVNVHTLLPQSLAEGGLDSLAAEADIVADHHLARLDHLCVGAPDTPGNVLVQLVRDTTAYVIGLETCDLLHGDAPYLSV
jgi:hypothetical protein